MACTVENGRLYCNTADVNFGPNFRSDDEARCFLDWHFKKYGDPRGAKEPILHERLSEFENDMEREVLDAICDRKAAVEHTRSKVE